MNFKEHLSAVFCNLVLDLGGICFLVLLFLGESCFFVLEEDAGTRIFQLPILATSFLIAVVFRL